MYSLNRIKLIGYVTETPEIRQIPNGMSVCDVNLRVISKVEKDKDGGFFDTTSFHSVTFWGKQAENIAQYTHVGSQIYVEGRLKTENWESEPGKKRYKTKVIAEDMVLLTPQNGGYPAIKSEVFGTGVNNVEIIGNLTKDLEVRQTPNGHTVGTISVASNRKWKDKMSDEMKEETEYHNLVLWNSLAKEGEAQMKKGRKVYISGRVQTRSWDSPEGEKRYTTEIIVEKCSLLGSEAPVEMNGGSNGMIESTIAVAAASSAVDEFDIPEIPTIQYESNIKPEDLPF